jgi:hypothetical protein
VAESKVRIAGAEPPDKSVHLPEITDCFHVEQADGEKLYYLQFADGRDDRYVCFSAEDIWSHRRFTLICWYNHVNRAYWHRTRRAWYYWGCDLMLATPRWQP